MKKVKVYILITVLFTLLSCKIDRVKQGIIYGESKSDNADKGLLQAKREIYKKLANALSKEIGREDINVIAGEIEIRSIIDFSSTNKASIKIKKSKDSYYTKIKINDNSLYTNTIAILSEIKQEGIINSNTFRAKAEVQIDKDTELSPFTRASIEKNTLNRALNNLYETIIKNNIDINSALEMTNRAYIVEEIRDTKTYRVVVESVIE